MVKLGLLFFFTILLVGAFIYLFRELTSHREVFFNWLNLLWSQFNKRPKVQAFIEEHPRLLIFLRDRISAKHYLGFHLTIGLLLSAVFVRVFAEITENILEHGPLENFDQWVYGRTAYLQDPFSNEVMRSITFLGDRKTLTVATLLLTTYFLFRRKMADAVTIISAMIGGSFLSQVLKFAIHRPRPLAEHALIEANGFSFPSGHSMMSAIFYGLLAYFTLSGTGYRKIRVTVSGLLLTTIVLVGLSRIYLQVHYLSDVAAGFTGGLFYLVLCLTGLEVYHRKNRTTQAGIRAFKNETL